LNIDRIQYKFDLIRIAACISTEFLLTNHWNEHEGKALYERQLFQGAATINTLWIAMTHQGMMQQE